MTTRIIHTDTNGESHLPARQKVGQPGSRQIAPVRSFFVEWTDNAGVEESKDLVHLGPAELVREARSADKTMRVAFSHRLATKQISAGEDTCSSGILSLGDPWEWKADDPTGPMGNAASVHFDLRSKRVVVTTSITGLPPVYEWRGTGRTIITSDLCLLASALGSNIWFDAEGVADLCTYGYPVDHRTLFQNTRLCPAATRITIDPDGSHRKERCWSFPSKSPMRNWVDFTELQSESFLAVLRVMDMQRNFLSLTAGLDTRTIVAALAHMDRLIPAYTMSGSNWTVDARAARALSTAYGIEHEVVLLDTEFLRSLPDMAREASRWSGGLASLEQSHEVYLYRKLGQRFSARLSGNMGNQLGRTGVEHVSMRNADPSLLSRDLQNRARRRTLAPWYEKGLREQTVYEFLLQQEVPFTLAGNFSIGHHFAEQQSPYASRKLFELCPLKPVDSQAAAPSSSLHLRLNDLRHRFLGEPEERSFQRHLIRKLGGVAASYPINWGWRAKGGVSVSGASRGLLSLLDAFAVRQQKNSGPVAAVLDKLRITGLHEYRKWGLWMRTALREFTHDTLLAANVQQSGLFDRDVLARMLNDHYRGTANHHRTLVLALDLALAAQEFGASFR